jgi:hypothetical protein
MAQGVRGRIQAGRRRSHRRRVLRPCGPAIRSRSMTRPDRDALSGGRSSIADSAMGRNVPSALGVFPSERPTSFVTQLSPRHCPGEHKQNGCAVGSAKTGQFPPWATRGPPGAMPLPAPPHRHRPADPPGSAGGGGIGADPRTDTQAGFAGGGSEATGDPRKRCATGPPYGSATLGNTS